MVHVPSSVGTHSIAFTDSKAITVSKKVENVCLHVKQMSYIKLVVSLLIADVISKTFLSVFVSNAVDSTLYNETKSAITA